MSKGTISIVTLGHVDHGKSTVLGRFLYETGNVEEQVMKKIETTSDIKRDNLKFPWASILDVIAEEQKTGNTQDISFYPFTIGNKDNGKT